MSDNLSFVLRLAKMYISKSWDETVLKKTEVSPTNKNGYDWYPVGHNASHSFYLAVDSNDKMFVRSYCGEDQPIEGVNWSDIYKLYDSENEKDLEKAYSMLRFIEEEHVSEVTQDNLGYIGHW